MSKGQFKDLAPVASKDQRNINVSFSFNNGEEFFYHISQRIAVPTDGR